MSYSTNTVMISHSSKDIELVEKVVSALSSKGIESWASFKDIKAGENWSSSIDSAISKCSFFLLILTPNSNVSKHVHREITIADNLLKLLFCFQLEDFHLSQEIKYFYINVQRTIAYQHNIDQKLSNISDEIKRYILQKGIIPTYGKSSIQNANWIKAANTKNLNLINEYIQTYPEGIYALDAKAMIQVYEQLKKHDIEKLLCYPDITNLNEINVFNQIKIAIENLGKFYIGKIEFHFSTFTLSTFDRNLEECHVVSVLHENEEWIEVHFWSKVNTVMQKCFFSLQHEYFTDVIKYRFLLLKKNDNLTMAEKKETKTLPKKKSLFINNFLSNNYSNEEKIVFFMITIRDSWSNTNLGSVSIFNDKIQYRIANSIDEIKLIYKTSRDDINSDSIRVKYFNERISKDVYITFSTGDRAITYALEMATGTIIKKFFRDYSDRELPQLLNINNIKAKSGKLYKFNNVICQTWSSRRNFDRLNLGSLYILDDCLYIEFNEHYLIVENIYLIELMNNEKVFDEKCAKNFIRIFYTDKGAGFILLLYQVNLLLSSTTESLFRKLATILKNVKFAN